jgi:ABC-type transport system involved in multi-copper enzyme maturation permease subunit
MHSMFKSLLWKEWRENQSIFIGAISSIILLSLFFYLLKGNTEWVTGLQMFFMILLIPIFSAGVASNLFAEEYNKQTIEFLKVLPISRENVWWSKIAFGLVLIFVLINIINFFFLSSEYKTLFDKEFTFGYPLLVIFTFLSALPFFFASLFMGMLLKKSSLGMFLGLVLPLGFSSILSAIFGFIISMFSSARLLNNFMQISEYGVNFIIIFWITGYLLFCYICFRLAYYLFVRRDLAKS